MMKLSNDVEKYEIEVTKMGQNNTSPELNQNSIRTQQKFLWNKCVWNP